MGGALIGSGIALCCGGIAWCAAYLVMHPKEH
jgi:hypothetical protein